MVKNTHFEGYIFLKNNIKIYFDEININKEKKRLKKINSKYLLN